MKSYSVLDVVQTLSGVGLDADAGGFGESDFVKFAPLGPLFEDKIGADGEVTRYPTNENRCDVTITVMSTSDMNDRLSALLLTDISTENGAGAGAYLCKSKHGRTVVAAERAWIIGWPDDVSLGKEPGPVTWKLRLANAKMFFGGQ